MTSTGIICGFGHPLLDITADVTEEFLKKYDLEPNAVILGEEKHVNLVEDLVKTFKVRYSAGGSTQNAIRIAQHLLQKPKSCIFLGTVGADENGRILKEHATKEGVDAPYIEEESDMTGVCAVLLTNGGRNRSLVSFIGAASIYGLPQLKTQWAAVERASLFYCSGFSIRTGFSACLELANHAALSDRKTFAINLSAPYICQACTESIMILLPLTDIIFGNQEEALALAAALNWQIDDLPTIVGRLAGLPCSPDKIDAIAGGRIVIITNGDNPVLLGRGHALGVSTFPVPKVDSEKILDTNGAGDAFVGGFLGAFGMEKSIDACIQTGIGCAAKIIQVTGVDLSVFEQPRKPSVRRKVLN